MKGKYSISLLITIAVFVVLIAVSAYAYFAVSPTITNNAYINTTTPAGVATFSSTGESKTINVTAAQMMNSAVGTTISNTANVYANLKGVSSSTVFCTYHVYLIWDGTAYTKTSGVSGNEFTVSATSACTMSDSSSCNSSTTLLSKTATQISATASSAMDLGTGKIYTSSSSVTTSIRTAVTLTFYNLSADQTAQANKTYKAKIYVGGVTC